MPTRPQYQTTECGVASLAMILAYHGRHVPMEELRRVTGVSRDCLNAADMVRAGRHYGFECAAYRREPDDLRGMTFPFVAHLNFIHFVVVEGMTADWVLVNDPACGRSEISAAQFHDTFTGIVITFSPGTAFEPGGRRERLCSDLWRHIDGGAKVLLGLAALASGLSSLALVLVADRVALALDRAPAALAIVGALLLAHGALRFGQSRIFEAAYRRVSENWSTTLLNALVLRPFGYLSYRLPHEQVKSVHDIELIARLMCRDLLPAALTLVSAAIFLIALLGRDVTAGAFAAALTALLGGCLLALAAWRARDIRRVRQSADTDFGSMLARVAKIEDCKIAGMEHDFVAANMGKHAQAAVPEQRDAMARIAAETVGRVAQVGIVFGTGLIAAIAHGAGRLDLGGVVFIVVVGCALAHALRDWPALRGKLDQLHHALLRNADVEAGGAAEQALPVSGEPADPSPLRFRDVTFGHSPTRPPLLDGVDFSFRDAAEQVGITGPSGGGKSTFAALAAGLQAPWSGTVEGGPHVMWVDKSPFLFDGTVRENLLLWRADIDDMRLWRALQDACLDDVISARPGGLDAVLVERGRNFSGGQRQRLEIARALTFEPTVLILDEALDALNPALEARLRANLRARGCALLIVSHRASTLAACERLLHFADGELHDRRPVDMGRALPVRAPIESLFQAPDGARAPRHVESEPVPAGYSRAVCFRIPAHWRQPDLPMLGRRRSDGAPVLLLPAPGGYRIDGERRPTSIDDVEPTARCLYPPADLTIRTPGALLRGWTALVSTDLLRALALAGAGVAAVLALAMLTALPLTDGGAAPQWKIWASLAGGLAVFGLLESARRVSLLRATHQVKLAAVDGLSQRLIRIRAGFFRTTPPATLARAFAGLYRLPYVMCGLVPTVVTDGVLVLGGCLALGRLDVRLGATAALLAAASVGLQWALSLPATALQRDLDHRQQAGRRFLFDMMRGIARLRVVGAQTRAATHWRTLFAGELAVAGRLHGLSEWGRALGETWLWGTLVTLACIAPVIGEGTSPAGHTLTAMLLVWPVSAAAFRIGEGLAEIRRTTAPLPNVRALLQAPLEPTGHVPGTAAVLELENAGFQFDGAPGPALDGISLRISPGEFIAVVGPSGSGKSTLLRLLLGFEPPSHGRHLIDGWDAGSVDVGAWRARIGVVQQDDVVDNASTLRGIIADLADADIDDVWRAVELAQLGDDIRAMPMGLQTIVEHGKLSTGQEQRLLIARQLLRRPSLLFLDEATNAIAEDMQARLFAALRAEGIGCILATHRESAIAAADRVLMMADGRLVWQGGPADFVADQEFMRVVRSERLVENEE